MIKKGISCASIFVFLTLGFCATQPVNSESAYSVGPSKESKPTEINLLLIESSSNEGKQVHVEGSFKGWKGLCIQSTQKTRSDWIIEDNTGCIYITGMIPNSLDPSNPKNEKIRVIGKLIIYNNTAIIAAHDIQLVNEQ